MKIQIPDILIYIALFLSKLGEIFLYPFRFGINLIYKLDEIIIKVARLNFSLLVKSIQLRSLNFFQSLLRGFGAYLSFVRKRISNKTKNVGTKISEIKTKKKTKVKKSERGSISSFIKGMLFAAIVLFVPYTLFSWYSTLPNPEDLTKTQYKTTQILDRNGKLLYEIYVDRKYKPVKLDQIPEHTIQATLAIEDAQFYKHIGIRPLSMLRALRSIIVEEELQGGSTITQQLVKNVLLTPERTIQRKIKEIVLAVLVEGRYTKDDILEMYLNNIAYGGTAWGIQSASQKYFGKDVSELNLAESAFLAGLPSAPSIYSPFSGDIELSKQRQKAVLERMVDLRYITLAEADEAYESELLFAPQADYIRAPHFVDYIRNELYKDFGRRYVDFGGLTVRTTLDLDLQEKVQKIVNDEIDSSEYLNISNGAAVVLDVKSGGILAYVGSRDYFDFDEGKFDVVTANRQPGSSIKPVTYALAFTKGFTPASIIRDDPTTFDIYGQKYSPVNYDGKYHGNVTLRTALANSYNVAAVNLINKVGVEEMVALANSMGLKNWVFDSTFGLSVTLGGKEVRLLDLANVYATFARKGVYRDVNSILEVKNDMGESIYYKEFAVEQVLDEGVAYLISHILSDNNSRAATFGSNSSLNIRGHRVAVKTGTTDEKRDNWTLGYTPSYVVGVWVGNNDNTPMDPRLASGLSGAAPIWNQIFSALLDGQPAEDFDRPQDVFVKIDEDCDNISEVFIRGSNIPKNLCVKEKKEKSN